MIKEIKEALIQLMAETIVKRNKVQKDRYEFIKTKAMIMHIPENLSMYQIQRNHFDSKIKEYQELIDKIDKVVYNYGVV